MKILFITRKYPPQIGGMEQFSEGLYNNYEGEKELIALKASQAWLPLWLVYAFLKALRQGRDADVIHLGDAVLAPLGWVLQKILKKPIVITVHGLDIVWPPAWYQKYFVNILKKISRVVCVSRSTEEECKKRGIHNTIVIPNAIDPKKFKTETSANFGKRRILLSVGRQVPRKGFSWFVGEVIAALPQDIIYVVAGGGPEKIPEHPRAQYLGKVSYEKLSELYSSADIMILPNIAFPGDKEGFCITAIEASSTGLPVIASNIDGLKDSVLDGKTGFLVESSNPQAFINKIQEVLSYSRSPEFRKSVQRATLENFSWERIKKDYKQLFSNLCRPST